MRELFSKAKLAKFGIVITTDNPELLKQRLYAARREANDPTLAGFSIITSPADPDGEVWIVKNAKEVAGPDQASQS